MATTLPPLADDDLGTDIALLDDLAPVLGIASGKTNLAMALYRRLTTTRGTLFYDPGYGYNITDLLNAELDAAALSAVRGAINAECEKDERVQLATTSLTFTAATKTLDISVEVETADGPFELVLRVTETTVDILRLGGQDVLPIPSRPDAVVVVVSGPGDVEVVGGDGPSFDLTGGLKLWLESDYHVTVDMGNEVMLWEDRTAFANHAETSTVIGEDNPFLLDGVTGNGKPGLVASTGGVLQSVAGANLFDTNSPRTVFVVALVDSADQGCVFLDMRPSDGSATTFAVGLWNYSNAGIIYPYTDGITVSQATAAGPGTFPGAVKVFKYRFTGSGKIQFGVDGAAMAPLTGSDWSSETAGTGYLIGAFIGTTFQRAFKGTLYAILAYDTALSDDDMTTVLTYLAAKYQP